MSIAISNWESLLNSAGFMPEMARYRLRESTSTVTPAFFASSLAGSNSSMRQSILLMRLTSAFVTRRLATKAPGGTAGIGGGMAGLVVATAGAVAGIVAGGGRSLVTVARRSETSLFP